MNADVVYKRDNKWFTGKVTDDKLRKKKQIKKLSDATENMEYLTLKQWLKSEKDKSDPDDILTKFKVSRLYIKKVDIVEAVREKAQKTVVKTDIVAPTEKEWWSKFNDLCLSCKKKCKQSSFVTIVSCKREPCEG